MSRILSTASTPPAATLPVQLTGFVGRAQEVDTLRRLVAGGRLLTLTGAGGSGKTRLALATVTSIRDAGESDVAWVELASLAEPGTLAAHLALTLGARAEGGGSAEQGLVALLRDRALLLVLDNCEHVVDECARLVDVLLRGCSQLRVLATSREALGIGGERSWLVPALSLPADTSNLSVDEAMHAESVRLFVERAQDVLPTFTLSAHNASAVARLCRRVDGLPLAIELAAARINVLTPHQIAERLDDRFSLLTSGNRSALPRHRTLRAAVDWSYDLLTRPERILLQRLSVFAGGFTLDAVEQVCADEDISESAVLDLLASLTTRSLVAMQEDDGRARYRLLETIREYALARRAEAPASSNPHERHATFYLALAQRVEPELILGRMHRLRQMDIEQENVRVALAWSAATGEGTRYGLPLCWSLTWYWFHRQLWREGFAHFELAMRAATDPSPALRAGALHAMGLFGLYAGDPHSRARLAEADALWRSVGNQRWLAFTLLVRTVEASLRRDPVEARVFAQQAVAAAHELGEPWVVALTMAHALVPVLVWEEAWEEAETQLVQAERIYRDHDYAIGVAYVLDARAFVSLQRGEHTLASSLASASLREDPQSQNRWLAGRSLRILGAVAFARGAFARSAQLFGAAAEMYEVIGANSLSPERRAVNELPDKLRDAMSTTEFETAWQLGRAMSFDAVVSFALEGQPDAAVQPTDSSFQPGAHSEVNVEARPHAPRVPPLAVRALGPLEILRDGVPVATEAWSYAKPRELLLYLLANPEGRTRDRIGLDFWPDISAAQVKNNFHVTLHHVRKALGGADWIRYERGRYRVPIETGVVFDASEFETQIVSSLKRLKVDGADANAAQATEHALALYRGGFLEDESAGDWHLELRDRLARLYEDGLHALASHYEQQADHARAEHALRRLLAVDVTHEAVARRLMRALAAAGRRPDALRVYDELVRRVRAELETAPDRETQQLAEEIKRGVIRS